VEIKGKYNTAKVFNDNIGPETIAQIINLCNQEAFQGQKIRIMPDAHKGAGCVIGYTAELGCKVVPNLIGVDIGCGMLATNLGQRVINFENLDNHIRSHIPFGFGKNKSIDLEKLTPDFVEDMKRICKKLSLNFSEKMLSIGSLGSGNHFIEINEDSDMNKWLVIHSGSRNFGLQIANYHQKKAVMICREKKNKVEKSLAYLEFEDRDEYCSDMKTAQLYASLNRKEMAVRILNFLSIKDYIEQFETIHNYINFKDKIIRKGAISAHEGEKMIIPLNMRDGSIIATGKGNPDWNYSAPHGAGRKMSRGEAKQSLNIEDFKNSMKHVWTSCVTKHTLDEAPMAYKSKSEIIGNIAETAEIIDIMKPLYNFKG